MKIGSMHKLPPSSAGTIVPSPGQTTITAQHTNKGQTMPDLVYFDCQAGGTLPFSTAYNSLREIRHFNILDSESHATLSINNSLFL